MPVAILMSEALYCLSVLQLALSPHSRAFLFFPSLFSALPLSFLLCNSQAGIFAQSGHEAVVDTSQMTETKNGFTRFSDIKGIPKGKHPFCMFHVIAFRVGVRMINAYDRNVGFV